MMQCSLALTRCCLVGPRAGCLCLPLLGPSLPCAMTGRLLVFLLGRRAACHSLSGSCLCACARRHSRGGFARTRSLTVASPRSCFFDGVWICPATLARAKNPSSTPHVDGSVLLPGPWTSSAYARSFASLFPPAPCWTRRQAPSLREFLRPDLLPLSFHGHLRTSVSCCCGASGSLCRSLPRTAAADVAWTR